MSNRGLTLVVGVVLALSVMQPVQKAGCTQTSQLALTRALAAGTARIDRWQQSTCDKAWFDHHYYSVKAPGLAAVALPPYLALRSAHILPGHDTTLVWLLGLLTVVPAALLLAWATGRVAERVQPGSGTLTAVTLGVATLALPFGTLWFGHVPAAALAFAAFMVLLEAPTRKRAARAAFAGILAGAAVLFEYPVALLAACLLVYSVARHGPRAGASFLVGTTPAAFALFAYNTWAFGSPTHFSYADAVIVTGNTGHDVIGANDSGFFGITWPSLGALTELLLSPRGLVTLTPICVLGTVGVLLLRRRATAEAILAGVSVIIFLAYNAGYTLSFGGPFGGDSPGPRFLIAVLPFLLFPIGAAARLLPGATATLLAGSAAAMTLASATGPMVGAHETHTWLAGLRDGSFVTTVWSFLGAGHGWGAVLPFVGGCFVLTLIGARLALAGAHLPSAMFEATYVAVAWLLLLYASSLVYDHHRDAIGVAMFVLATVTTAVGFAARQYVVASTAE